ncbi:hypothetical protein M9H77_04844 [Catharanthus roseus]|uniref:Uncharacterized protein n=2 Tax=Catharanthus roseus TaxID=4058 RepID=A0ACC0CF97_CATRO|nr:gamma-tocopherol methyltransferase-related protein [Catharanthus roseus]KAI5683616.1 hypothetical protein M9H77_04844 [Catharanthus roseus]
MAKKSSVEQLQEKDQEKFKGVADLYGGTSRAWEDILGDHWHHGYYDPGSTVSKSDNAAALIRMIDEVLRFGSVFSAENQENKPKRILDIGCGIGGTCTYLARKYGAHCTGITISSGEVERAQALATAQGLQEKVSFEVANALALPFPDGQFDLVWCMETAEHIPEKEQLVKEIVRVAAPGGQIILTSWCHRNLLPSEQSLPLDEQKFIKKMCDLVLMHPFCSVNEYINLFQSHHVEDMKTDDWCEFAKPFWTAMVGSACTIKGFFSLLWIGGWNSLKFVMGSNMMIKAHKKGLVKLLVLSCRKPR